MINTDGTFITNIIHHSVIQEENAIINDQVFSLEDEKETDVLKKILLKPFTNHAVTFEFTHDVDLEYNVLFNLSRHLENGEDFVQKSQEIMQHLDSVSKHPNIKGGDVFIAEFRNIKLGNDLLDGIGIYKFEEKEPFLETRIHENKLQQEFRKGFGTKKPDKACLILFTEEPYTLAVIDNHTKETNYWQNDFIQLKPKNDFVNNTTDLLNITKDFVTKQLDEDFEVSKADKIDLLNRSVEYFKGNETFDKSEFEEQVFGGDSDVIESFQSFDESYRQENNLEIAEKFEISEQAVKKQARAFKSVLKLDKNFHIYIHGDKKLIEKGVDNDGRKFYKIYFEEEK